MLDLMHGESPEKKNNLSSAEMDTVLTMIARIPAFGRNGPKFSFAQLEYYFTRKFDEEIYALSSFLQLSTKSAT